jgi:hypothetical protein
MRLRAFVVVLAAAALVAPAVAAADPASLSGEVFSATFVESVGNCTTLPNPVIHFHASGTAAGPYAGTFDETGIAVVDASGTGFNFGPLLDVTTRFTINSAAGRVFGIKQFTTASSGIGHCQILTPGIQRYKEFKATNLSYLAVIFAVPAMPGLWVDCGSSPDMFFDNSTARAPVPQVFGETFLSRLKSAIPASRAGECL